jgi:hypothetical protein
MMSSVKHHDKVTFFEFPLFHLPVKNLFLLNLHNFNGLVGFQLQFVQFIKLQQSMGLGFIQTKSHSCGNA